MPLIQVKLGAQFHISADSDDDLNWVATLQFDSELSLTFYLVLSSVSQWPGEENISLRNYSSGHKDRQLYTFL